MTVAEILNLVKCGSDGILGTGIKGCKPFFKKVTAVWLTKQGFVFPDSQDFTEEYIKSLQASGDLIVLRGIKTFTDNTPDDTIDELEDGTKQVAREGLYEFALMFVNGLYFDTALHSLNSFGNYDVTLIDRDGNILGTSVTGGFKGFTLGMLHKQKFSWATDAQGEREGIAMQLLERDEFDADKTFIQRKQLDFNPNRIDGVNELVVTYAAVPTDSETTITLDVKTKMDNKPFTGLTFSDFLVTVDGATSNPTAGDDSAKAGTYVLTVAALSTNESIASRVYDNQGNKPVVALDTDLYKSNIATAVVV